MILAILIAIGVLSILTAVNAQVTQRREIDGNVKVVETLMAGDIEGDIQKLHALLTGLGRDREGREAFLSQDRARLLLWAQPLFAEMRQNHSITHVYFHTQDRVTWLRVHQPDRHGDRIDRFSLKEAERTGEVSSGVELGPLGAFTLRAVMPWRQDGELIGYIELGQEIDHVISKLHKTLGVDVIVTLRKEVLNREDWESGRAIFPKHEPWDRFKAEVVADKTLAEIPPPLHPFLDREGQHPPRGVDLRVGGRDIHAAFLDLKESNGRSVGDLIILRDITAFLEDQRNALIRVVLTITFAGGMVCLLLWVVLTRVERTLQKSNRFIEQQARDQTVISSILSLSLEPIPLEDFLEQTLSLVFSREEMHLEKQGCIFLVDDESGELVLKAQQGLSEPLLDKCARVPLGTCLCGQAAAQGEIIYTENVDSRHEIDFPGMHDHGHYCVPIESEESVLGVLTLYVPPGHQRSEIEDRFVSSVAVTLAGALRRKTAEDALRQSEERYRSVVQSTNDAVIAIDSKDNVISWNTAAGAMFGYSEEEILGRPLALIIPKRYQDRHLTGLARINDQGIRGSHVIGWTVQLEGLRRDGREFPIELSLGCWQAPTGTFFSGVVRDITERVAAEEAQRGHAAALAHAHRVSLLGEMAAGLAHELSQPLTAILNYTKGCAEMVREMVRSGSPRPDQLLEPLEFAVADAERAAEIVRSVRRFARREETPKAWVDVNDAIRGAVFLMGKEIHDGDVTLDLAFAPSLPKVLADTIQVQQVVLNLVRNGIEAMAETPPPRRLSITTESSGPGAVVVTVRDNGKGIPLYTRESIFKPFVSTKPDGMGLGLSICRSLVESHGGKLVAEPVPQGALFRFTLPVSGKRGDNDAR